MDIWTYFLQKQREFADNSAYPQKGPEEFFDAAEDGQDGRMFVKLGLTPDAYLQVFEAVRVKGSAITRDAYAYTLVIDEELVMTWERDPTHDPAVHEHVGPERTRRESEPIPLKYALDFAWKEISLRAEAPW